MHHAKNAQSRHFLRSSMSILSNQWVYGFGQLNSVICREKLGVDPWTGWVSYGGSAVRHCSVSSSEPLALQPGAARDVPRRPAGQVRGTVFFGKMSAARAAEGIRQSTRLRRHGTAPAQSVACRAKTADLARADRRTVRQRHRRGGIAAIAPVESGSDRYSSSLAFVYCGVC